MPEMKAQRIQLGDDIQPVRANASRTGGDVVPAHVKELALSEKHEVDLEARAVRITDEDLNSKKKQTYTGWILLWLSYQSTGVIYGDIGTSPLYVYSSSFTSHPSYADLVGVLSIIIWSLTLIVSVKYVFIVLAADDDGEGGTFALYSLLAKYARIVREDPKSPKSAMLERHLTKDLRPMNKSVRNFIERSGVAKTVLKVLGVLGVSMVIADGVLTPAQSVLGAIQGIRVASPDVTTSTIIGVTCAILVLLFVIQPFGITKLGTGFAPIVIIWLTFNMICGIYNLVKFDHTVLKAFSPHFAIQYFIRNKTEGWRSLGGILLCFTGVEALFADLGAFSKRAIQLSWLCFVFPCLLLAYIGQAAYISADATQEAYTNPFFNSVPPGTLYFSLVLAILAAIVASQAMITGSFQLLAQVMRMSYFPHIKMVHTSKLFHGQIYIPLANWLLMIGTVAVTAVYSNTTRLGNAYGVCVIFVTLITTCLVSLVAIVIWKINLILVIFVFLFFAFLDGLYLSSVLMKVPEGAWFTLLLSALLSTVFILWRFGKESQWKSESLDNFEPSNLLITSADGSTVNLNPSLGGGKVSTVGGIGIFFDKVGTDMVPIVFAQFVRKFSARPEIIVYFHMRPLSIPSIPEAERYLITRTSIPGCYRMTIRHGYTDSIVSPDLGRLITEQLILFITRDTKCSGDNVSSKDHSPEVQAELDVIYQAAQAQMVYIMGKEQMTIKKSSSWKGWPRRIVLEAFLWIRENSRTKMADMDIPYDNLVEVGFVKEI